MNSPLYRVNLAMTCLQRSEVDPEACDPENKQDVWKHRLDVAADPSKELALLRIERFSEAD